MRSRLDLRSIRVAVLGAMALCLTVGGRGGSAEAGAPAPPDTAYRVVVHTSNPTTALPREQVAKFFLKKTTAWANGVLVVPVDQGESSPVRREFSKRVLKKDVQAVKGYWQQLIFTGRGVSPVEKASDAEVMAFVAANPGGIGYVSSSAKLGAGLKAIQIRE